MTFLDNQSDLSRLTSTLRAVIEVNECCWRGDSCELSNGVRAWLEQVAAHTQQHSEIAELNIPLVEKGLGHHSRITEGTDYIIMAIPFASC